MKYDPKTPSGRAMKKILRYMLDELEGNYHEVVLIPAPDPMHSGHKVRATQYANARWYQKFNQEYVSIRGRGRKVYKRPRTYIIRGHTIKALQRMIAGNFEGVYADRLIQFVEHFRANHRYKKNQNREYARADAAGEYDDIPF